MHTSCQYIQCIVFLWSILQSDVFLSSKCYAHKQTDGFQELVNRLVAIFYSIKSRVKATEKIFQLSFCTPRAHCTVKSYTKQNSRCQIGQSPLYLVSCIILFHSFSI
jgi:hypothetical protein